MAKKTIEKITPYVILLIIGIFLLLLFSIVRTSVFGQVDEEQHIYFEIVFLLLLAVLGELAVIYTKQPSVMILMVIGILISPSFISIFWEAVSAINFPIIELPKEAPEILKDQGVLHVFAQLGAIILLFKVGLHNKIENIFSRENLIVAALGVVVPFVAGYFYAINEGGSFAYSMFVGAALTATSVGVTVAILKEFKLMQENFAKIIIGAAILDDILGLLVLSFVINVTGVSGEASTISLLTTLVMAFVFLVGSVAVGSYFIKYLDRKELSARRFLLVLAIVLFYAYVAEFIRLSAIVGAFMAGVMINQSRHLKEIEEKTYGLEMLFMPIFFISLGMMMDVNSLMLFFVPIIIISIVALLTKVVGCGFGAMLAKLKTNEALAVGFGMAPRGEVALIIAAIGLSTKVLDVSEYSIIATMALLTTVLTPPILQYFIEKIKKENQVISSS
ncbi:MAG: cation:proton antiporter [Candidatus Paceibacterota bacterium]|jgi:Kef-type K+ transport system membrane component KefB